MKTKFIRRPEVESRLAISRSTIYNQINEGLFPSPIMIGTRAVAWIEHEVEQFQQALMMGLTTDELRKFVAQLQQARRTM